ncbi:ornithine cyclodeaminase family protein [Cupriavidus sp. SW-Y-13]|uniref:ornithine cyclodeaminase family protein n=1 Tax=Cupriavidus sp. SW-Y-13 TaxID=2653854 RepID=UPI001365A348|nr:ornithine cyclodeaminase family protein [Cupriavidus sp. SW-Y-13]MWL90667.1 ornithine cyclodeaminase family protein [Cupriavidus sp. SW-Y-13]
MLHITDAMIDRHVTAADAQGAMREAFRSFGQGDAAMQERIRTEAGGVKLSTLGAVIPTQQVAGAKIYTTIAGQFSFVILLFSTVDGRPLASFDAGAITRLRTAACTVLAAQQLARPGAETLALFGAGTQGVQHALQLSAALPLRRILICDPYADTCAASRLAKACGISVEFAKPEDAAAAADIIVTASRSTTPLFSGDLVRPGAFVAAIGSSLPQTRELDDTLLARAAAVVVEWRPQSLREAGDLVLADKSALPDSKIVELSEVLLASRTVRQSDDDIVIYKSVGVGLEDVALAGVAWQRIEAAQALAA